MADFNNMKKKGIPVALKRDDKRIRENCDRVKKMKKLLGGKK